jgi:hypothetical protein
VGPFARSQQSSKLTRPSEGRHAVAARVIIGALPASVITRWPLSNPEGRDLPQSKVGSAHQSGLLVAQGHKTEDRLGVSGATIVSAGGAFALRGMDGGRRGRPMSLRALAEGVWDLALQVRLDAVPTEAAGQRADVRGACSPEFSVGSTAGATGGAACAPSTSIGEHVWIRADRDAPDASRVPLHLDGLDRPPARGRSSLHTERSRTAPPRAQVRGRTLRPDEAGDVLRLRKNGRPVSRPAANLRLRVNAKKRQTSMGTSAHPEVCSLTRLSGSPWPWRHTWALSTHGWYLLPLRPTLSLRCALEPCTALCRHGRLMRWHQIGWPSRRSPRGESGVP